MVPKSPYTFQTKAEKCIYTSVMESLDKYGADSLRKALISAEDPSNFLTYNELKKQIMATEVFLNGIGFLKAQVGACVMPSNIEIIPFYLAVVGRGGIYTGMMPMLTELFTTTEHLDKVRAATGNMEKEMTIICLGATESLPEKVHKWSDVIRTKGEAPKHTNDIHDTAVLPYSSGTTGLRKGIKLSHFNIMSAALNIIRHSEEYLPKPISPEGKVQSIYDRVQVMSFQAFHISGKLTVLPPILSGSTLVMLNKFDIKVYLETIQRHKVFNVLVSPVVILQIVKSPLSKDYDLSSLGYATCGGAPLSESLAKEFMQKYPQVMLTQAYGMSECTFSTFPLCDRRSNFAAAGYITPGYEAKIIDLETGEELGPNEKGEYIVKGPSLMSEYHKNPQATNASKDEEGFFHTGDLGYFTEKGELFIIDRKKDLMKINDHQVAPAEIESALAIDPRILDVAVAGIPHLKSGQVPAAFIVKKDQTLTEAEVLFLIKQRIAEFKWGEGVITFVDSIPKMPSGKVVRRQLLELLD